MLLTTQSRSLVSGENVEETTTLRYARKTAIRLSVYSAHTLGDIRVTDTDYDLETEMSVQTKRDEKDTRSAAMRRSHCVRVLSESRVDSENRRKQLQKLSQIVWGKLRWSTFSHVAYVSCASVYWCAQGLQSVEGDDLGLDVWKRLFSVRFKYVSDSDTMSRYTSDTLKTSVKGLSRVSI
ncbi:hypothetical protein Tco_1538756 [Tanacetum coccineum]|uniref:Uncharacterized protein n=1 Tax=Tanacetum coccineum TaxID=301880 RepID=A0ABQ5BDD0_9ASTR